MEVCATHPPSLKSFGRMCDDISDSIQTTKPHVVSFFIGTHNTASSKRESVQMLARGMFEGHLDVLRIAQGIVCARAILAGAD